jgi:hypothetical protein
MTARPALAADPSAIGRSADPGKSVIQACQRSLALAARGPRHVDIGRVAELRPRVGAVGVYSAQKQLGKDAQVAAAEAAEAVRQGRGTGQILGPVHPSPGRETRERRYPGFPAPAARPVTSARA